jgi:hypothetical protein
MGRLCHLAHCYFGPLTNVPTMISYTKKVGDVHEHTRISRVPVEITSMYCVVSKYLSGPVQNFVSEVGLIGRSLAVVALN